MMVLAGAVAASCAVSLAVVATPAVGAVAAGGGWGKAIEVPGLARLSAGNGGTLAQVSCSSAGNCAAGGTYNSDAAGHTQAFVVSEKNGTWGTAIEVPGLAALNTGGSADLYSLSCGSAGNCAAGGTYTGSGTGAFVVSEKNGTWGKAIALSGASGPNSVNAVSCASAGNCTAGGNGDKQPFVISETNGTWGKAVEIPGLAALAAGTPDGVSSVSCASAGNCAVAGFYGNAPTLAFVVSQKNGTWGTAIELPGSDAMGGMTLASVSCASAGNCATAGFFGDIHSDAATAALVASEKNGTWGKASVVPGTSTSARNGAYPVSCPSAGNCVAGGNEARNLELPYQAFVVSQRNGTWGQAIDVPGSAALNVGGNAAVNSVSCPSVGNCAAAGYYLDGSNDQQAFVASETDGTWGTAIEVPGSGALNTGGSAQVVSVSCAPAGYCAAGGEYSVASGGEEPFLVSRT
jgi:hypothetical protein